MRVRTSLPSHRARARARAAVAILYLLLTLVVTGLYRFVPHHVPAMYSRVLYYLFGNEGADVPAGAVRKGVFGWVQRNVSLVAR